VKKCLLLIILAGIICGCTSTEKQNSNKTGQQANSLQYMTRGEYAFYLDKRYSRDFYVGYLNFLTMDENTGIEVRSIDATTGKEERYFFIVTDDEDGFPRKAINIIGLFSKIETRQTLVDFFNFTSLYLYTQKDYKEQGEIDDDWGDYTLVFNFDKTLPFFRFSDIKLKGNDESIFQFLHGGVLDPVSVEDFYELKPVQR
jgi:hypothetical protein